MAVELASSLDGPELVLKIVASAVALAGAFVTAMRWLDQRRKDAETARVESRKPFAVKQQEIYLELVNVASLIVNSYDEAVRSEAKARFWIMFWGVVPLVADQQVAKAIDDYSEILFERPGSSTELLNSSMALARACRRSLGASWNADLQKLKPPRQPLVAG